MKIVEGHNFLRLRSGEDSMYHATEALLREKGHEVIPFTRDSRAIKPGIKGKLGAFASGVYSFSSARALTTIIREQRPDAAHFHNLYPLLSPSVLSVCKREGTPCVLSVHSYRMICCTGYLQRQGKACEECCKGSEYRCVLHNCRNNVAESAAYALRKAVARQLRLYRDNVDAYITPSKSVRDKLVEYDWPADRIVVVPNMVRPPAKPTVVSQGTYAAYAGRISQEKGATVLIEAARVCGIPLALAGSVEGLPGLRESAPPNVTFMGQLGPEALDAFYRHARFLVAPSECMETFGLAAAEAMGYGLPVIASRIAGLAEVVVDGETGLLCEPGNTAALTRAMRRLWDDTAACARMGAAARERVFREYSPDVHYTRLMDVIEMARARRG